MSLSLEWLKQYAVSKGGYDITPQARHLQDLKALLNDQEIIRGEAAYEGALSLGDLYDEFLLLSTCTCDAESIADSDGSLQSVVGCTCDNRCSCNSYIGSCNCDARCDCDSYIGACDCESRCSCNDYTTYCPGTCSSNACTHCDCNSQGECVCNYQYTANVYNEYLRLRTIGCTCDNRCSCNSDVGCYCDNRCSCNSNIGTCDCEARCSCNTQNTCTCNTRCSCNTQRVFS